MLRKYEKKLI